MAKKSLAEEKEAQEVIDKKLVDAFLSEYKKLSDKHGFDIGAELVYGQNGIGVKLNISKKQQHA